jgi:hypothetical protein
MVANFSFVFYLTRPDPREKAFPMAELPSVEGQATDLREITFDGDVGSLHYLALLKTRIDDLPKINIRSPLSRTVPHEGPGFLKTAFIY